MPLSIGDLAFFVGSGDDRRYPASTVQVVSRTTISGGYVVRYVQGAPAGAVRFGFPVYASELRPLLVGTPNEYRAFQGPDDRVYSVIEDDNGKVALHVAGG